MDALDGRCIPKGMRPHAQRLQGIDAGSSQGKISFVVARLLGHARQGRFNQCHLETATIEGYGQAGAYEATTHNDDVVQNFHVHMILTLAPLARQCPEAHTHLCVSAYSRNG
jgi:hypothetical protein